MSPGAPTDTAADDHDHDQKVALLRDPTVRDDLPPEVQAGAFRVVQEAPTNVRRHRDHRPPEPGRRPAARVGDGRRPRWHPAAGRRARWRLRSRRPEGASGRPGRRTAHRPPCRRGLGGEGELPGGEDLTPFRLGPCESLGFACLPPPGPTRNPHRLAVEQVSCTRPPRAQGSPVTRRPQPQDRSRSNRLIGPRGHPRATGTGPSGGSHPTRSARSGRTAAGRGQVQGRSAARGPGVEAAQRRLAVADAHHPDRPPAARRAVGTRSAVPPRARCCRVRRSSTSS